MSNIPSSVAVFGASGTLGSSVVSALLATGKHKVTAVTRSESIAKLPSSVTTLRGDLNSSDFLEQCVQGQDAMIIALGLDAAQDIDRAIATAAAKHSVKYIFPNEFASQDSLRKRFPFRFHERKQEIRDLIMELGRSNWIAIVNGTWYDFSLANGSYNIDIPSKKAMIWTPSATVATVTTDAKVGKAIAALLSLSHDELQKYINRCVYVSSFQVSQLDILRSVQRATSTQDVDWKISYEDVETAVKDGQDSAAKGNVEGLIKVIYAMQFLPGAGGDYAIEHGTVNDDLGLKKEDLDAMTRTVVARLKA